MNSLYKNNLQIAFGVSIAVHIVMLLTFSGILIYQPEYSVMSGMDATEVELVPALPPAQQTAQATATLPTSVPNKKATTSTRPKTSHPASVKSKPITSKGRGAQIAAKPDYLSNPPPNYPEDARQAHQEGLVIIRAVISPNGSVLSVTISRSSGFASLDNAAMEAVQNWKFKPGSIAGVPSKSVVAVPVRFQLQQ